MTLSETYPSYFIAKHGNRYTIHPDGLIECWTPEEDIFFWYPKPTKADAVLSPFKSAFYEFKSNGRVYARIGEWTYFWGDVCTTDVLEGIQVCEDCYWSKKDPSECLSYQVPPLDEYRTEEE